jgi:hypothetical protein
LSVYDTLFREPLNIGMRIRLCMYHL